MYTVTLRTGRLHKIEAHYASVEESWIIFHNGSPGTPVVIYPASEVLQVTRT